MSASGQKHAAGEHAGKRQRESPLMLALVLLIALAAAAPLWGPGIVATRGGGDSPFLLARTFEIAASLRHGIFPVRWMAHAAYDLGYPFFNHYAALPYYVTGGLHALGINILLTIQITQTLGFVLAGLTMNLWLRQVGFGRVARLLAVAAFTFAPFHMVNVYVRGDSLSEFYAFAAYPLILWALDRVARVTVRSFAAQRSSPLQMPGIAEIAAAGMAYGALALTHNVSFVIFSPFALLYGLGAIWQYWRAETQQLDRTSRRPIAWIGPMIALFAAFAVGLLLTAWFWLPALVETAYGQMGPEFTEGYFNFSSHFRSLNLIQHTPGFDYSIAGSTNDAGPFAMGLVQALMALAGTVLILRSLIRSRLQGSRAWQHGFLLLGLAVATVMITPLSRPLWEHLPLLATTQFPWRFLSIQALFTAAITGAVAQGAPKRGRRLRPWIAVAGIALIASAGLGTLRPERLMIRAEDVTRETLLLYETFTGNIGTTIRYEYLPQDVVPRLYISEAVIDGEGALRAEGGVPINGQLVTRTPVRQVWTVTLPAAPSGDAPTVVPVAFPVNWWPGWRAIVDGVRVPTYPLTGSGRLAIDLTQQAGQERAYTVTLRVRATALAGWSGAVSAVTAAVGMGLWVVRSRGSRGRRLQEAPGAPDAPLQPRPQGGEQRRQEIDQPPEQAGTASTKGNGAGAKLAWGLGILLIAAFAPVAAGLIWSAPQGAATFFDFVQMPFPHQGPVHFGEAQLLAAQITKPEEATATCHPSGVTARPGESLKIQLDWDALPAVPMTATLRLVSPAAPRHGIDVSLVETHTAISEEMRLALALPEDLTRGLYLVQLRVTDADGIKVAHTPGGHGMGDLYIGAVRVPHGPALPSDAPVLAAFSDLTLHAVEADQPQPEELRLKLAWSTRGTPRNWRLSLRLLDADGNQVVARDHQPGYGYLPTTLWQPGEIVTDYTVLPLPPGLSPGTYTLRVVTYLLATMEGGGEVDLPVRLDTPMLYDLRDACCQQTRKGATIVCQAGHIALLGLEVPVAVSEGQALQITTEWNALRRTPLDSGAPGDLIATWRLVSNTGGVIAETSRPPAPGSQTSTWPLHTWVRSRLNLTLPARLAAGAYDLTLTLQEAGAPPVACGSVATVTVELRPRSFDVPALAHATEANFGSAIRLLGYEIEGKRRADGSYTPAISDRLVLTLWWQAEGILEQDYKRFVHLYDPASEQILAQDDAMPRNWTYPTSWWHPHEVVSETVTLDLAGVPGGAYRLGVGWYESATFDRLPAVSEPASAVKEDRLTLDRALILSKR